MNSVPPVVNPPTLPPVIQPAPAVAQAPAPRQLTAYDFVCEKCGHIGEPKTHTPGSIFIEIILWLCFILPGLIYSLWRISARDRDRCPHCLGHMIPAGSPRGQSLIRQFARVLALAVFTVLSCPAAQTPVQNYLSNARAANAANAQAAAQQEAEARAKFFADLKTIRGQGASDVPPSVYMDGNWQACTNQIVRLLNGMEKNNAEATQLKKIVDASQVAGITNAPASARLTLLQSYLVNQSNAVAKTRAAMISIEAKYTLQELKSHPKP